MPLYYTGKEIPPSNNMMDALGDWQDETMVEWVNRWREVWEK